MTTNLYAVLMHIAQGSATEAALISQINALSSADVKYNGSILLQALLENGLLTAAQSTQQQFGLDASNVDAIECFSKSACRGYLNCVQWIVPTFAVTASMVRQNNNFAFTWAAARGNLSLVQYLVSTFGLARADFIDNNSTAIIGSGANYNGGNGPATLLWAIANLGLTTGDITPAFVPACASGGIAILNQMNTMGMLTSAFIRANNDAALFAAAGAGQTAIVTLLMSLVAYPADVIAAALALSKANGWGTLLDATLHI